MREWLAAEGNRQAVYYCLANAVGSSFVVWLLYGLVPWLGRRSRLAESRRALEPLGFSVVGSDPSIAKAPFASLPLLRAGWGKNFCNVARGRLRDHEAVVFEFRRVLWPWEQRFEGDYDREYTLVVLRKLGAAWPFLKLTSKKAVRTDDADLSAFFLENPGWRVEAQGEWMALWRGGAESPVKAGAQDIRALLEGAFKVFDFLAPRL